MSVRENFADIFLREMHDRSMRSGTELAQEIQLTDWSIAGNLSNRSSGVQIAHDICTRFGRYLYSTKCSWIIKFTSQSKTHSKLLIHYTRDFMNISCRRATSFYRQTKVFELNFFMAKSFL